ncbi:MAG: ferrous iron transport protein A [Sulfurovaceae bacterium]|nr:ferrous iron transport protein A [Sulfurovaceae bacterium]
MKLSDLKKGDHAIILKIETNESLKGRLTSFGIARGTELSIEECSIAKKTMEIMVDDTLIGLRAKEASKIEVKQI